MSPFVYRIAADLTVVLHAGYASFVLVGLPLILLGIRRNWRWVRNFWFRAIHFLMILAVVAESLCGVVCPLTMLEKELRSRGGDVAYEGDFLANCVHATLFCEAPTWVFMAAYCAFGLAVLATFVVAPPRRPWRTRGPLSTTNLKDC